MIYPADTITELCLRDKPLRMPSRRIVFLLSFLLLHQTLSAQLPKVWVMDAERLASVKKEYIAGHTGTKKLIADLTREADQLLSLVPVSVMDKTITPPSGSRHDYMSQAPYFWYDSSKPNGLPYLRRDGERNPEINKITDRKNIGTLDNASQLLALAWYFTGEEKYAQKAATLLRTWFLDADTKMNPNLDYGQGIPGINTGRGIGIIETISLMGIADAAGLLEGSTAWINTDQAGLRSWYRQYLDWLLTSKNGREEHAAKNNHGTWYYAQAVDFALFSGDTKRAAELATESKQLMDGQIDSAGKQPLELERTNALWYSTYNLQAWIRLAILADKAGVDIWNHRNKNNTGISHSLDWIIPYATGKKTFTYQQIDKYNESALFELLLLAGKKYHNAGYLSTAKELKPGKNILTMILNTQYLIR